MGTTYKGAMGSSSGGVSKNGSDESEFSRQLLVLLLHFAAQQEIMGSYVSAEDDARNILDFHSK